MVWAEQEQTLPVPHIDRERCTGCGLCVEVCPNEALGMRRHTAYVAFPEACDYTGYCERICPTQAIARPFQIIVLNTKEKNAMTNIKFHWVQKVAFKSDAPQPYPLLDNDSTKMVLVGLQAEQQIPAHPAPASVYYIIEGSGWMTVDDMRFEIGPGVIVRTPDGAYRGVEAKTRLVFLGTHGKGDAYHDAAKDAETSVTQ